MKSILIIGMGRFGRHLAMKFTDLGNEVMVADKDSELIERMADDFADSRICDCTDENVLRSLGVSNFDYCFVAVGEDFQSALEITALLKEFGAKCVIAKANSLRHSALLKRIGADDCIYPEMEVAEKTAVRYNGRHILDFIEVSPNYAIYEIPVLSQWEGKTVGEINVRRKHSINIVAVKNGTVVETTPGAEYVFRPGDHLVVIGRSADVLKLTSKI